MTTRIYSGDDEVALDGATKIIKCGGVVAFPTETVYGLGANALDDEAVKRIFEIKGRPQDNPLIVHVHAGYDISLIAKNVPGYAEKLAYAFLPGPLTMVYESSGAVAPSVSCGLGTVAVRVPSHGVAQRFLKRAGFPVAAPSANVSKHVSPVTAENVLDDLDGKIECILDGGPCEVGIESTVLDCTGDIPVILRPGVITREDVERVAGVCGVHTLKDGEKVRSPGMKYAHYAPNCETHLFTYGDASEAFALCDELSANGRKVAVIADESLRKRAEGRIFLSLGITERDAARSLYAALREAEKTADAIVAVAPEKQDGIMTGVMNRLTKACGEKDYGNG